ncbi:MAG TPA: hypothetical protein VEL76_14945, partial [Gemmataceae bacterium]|nr:hypothetical protein [Gemmataceae bacterium]
TPLLRAGTKDKLLINGHFYSDKSPVPALLLALVYQVLQWFTGLTARVHPETFCYLMTLVSSGLPYVVAVWAVYRMGRLVQLPLPMRLALTASFALATVAPVYARSVNNHILLLGISAALTLGLAHQADGLQPVGFTWRWLAGLGTLAGLGYATDLGAGPPLLVCSLGLVAWRCRSGRAVGLFLLGALPWLVLHHAVNYATGGTFKPANAVPEYFLWDGCPFTPKNMTGVWNHDGFGGFVVYALALLFGKHGFVGHNLPLFLALTAMVVLLWRRTVELPEILFAGCWCGGTWLAYALTSCNYSGLCCSIRWFVPLLAPAYYVLAVALRRCPEWRGDFLILSGWGAVLTVIAWCYGPWIRHMVPGFWPLQGMALLCWLLYRYRAQGQTAMLQNEQATTPARPARAA